MKIRIIQFTRYATLPGWEKDLREELNGGELVWIALGHFDTMTSFQIDTGSNGLFEIIAKQQESLQNKNIKETTYVYQMYLISDEEDSFIWKNNYPFLAISRIHFYQNTDLKNLRYRIKESLKEYNDIKFVCYQSADLTDMVVVLASEKMHILIGKALNIRVNKGIGKSFTYFCINNTYDSRKIDNTDVVPMMNIRLSVFSTKVFEEQLNCIKRVLDTNQVHVISGSDDIEIFCENFPVKKLIKLYEILFKTDNGFKYFGFSDVSTSLGCINEEWNADEPDKTDINKKTEILLDIRNAIRQRSMNQNQYSKLLSEYFDLFTSFYRMSGTVVADEFVSLIYPSVMTFTTYLMNYGDLSGSTEKIEYFLKSWEHLNEMIILSEGQLNTYPEYHVRTNRITFSFLEYILAFLYRCEDFLKDEKVDTHNIFIVLDNVKRPETAEIIQNTNHSESLISITIPYELLFESSMTMRTLCHEMSHFVGEKLRNRNLRLDKYALSICAMISGLIFHSDDLELIKLLFDGTSGDYSFVGMRDYLEYREKDTIQETCKMAAQWCYDFFSKDSGSTQYDQLLRAIIVNCHSDKINIQIREKVSDDVIEILYNYCDMFAKLFREIFADLCMIKIIDVPMGDYVNIICSDIYDKNGNLVDNDNAVLMDVIRIYIVIKACGTNPDISFFKDYQEIYRYVKTLNRDFKSRKYIDINHINYVSIQAILSYAKTCVDNINVRIIEKQIEVNAIKDAFRFATTSDNDTEKHLETVLDSFRKKVLDM